MMKECTEGCADNHERCPLGFACRSNSQASAVSPVQFRCFPGCKDREQGIKYVACSTNLVQGYCENIAAK